MPDKETQTTDEQGWREASDPKNPRYAQKQRDIRNTVKRYTEAHKAVKDKFEQDMEEDYFDAALEVANRMQGNFTMGYSHIPQHKWDKIWEE